MERGRHVWDTSTKWMTEDALTMIMLALLWRCVGEQRDVSYGAACNNTGRREREREKMNDSIVIIPLITVFVASRSLPRGGFLEGSFVRGASFSKETTWGWNVACDVSYVWNYRPIYFLAYTLWCEFSDFCEVEQYSLYLHRKFGLYIYILLGESGKKFIIFGLNVIVI